MRFAIRTNYAGCWSCRRNSRRQQGMRYGSFRYLCREGFWRGCGSVIQTIRCCGKCCLSAEELEDVPGFVTDPVGDAAAERLPGLLQKYQGRVLLVTTGTCAVHCRYCFRRHFPYAEAPRSIDAWQPALDEIADDESIHEVILSGGDPLTIVDSVLEQLVDELAAIPHLRRLRVHTRLPIMIPERVTDDFVGMLASSRLTPIVVIHANHANELDSSVAEALRETVSGGDSALESGRAAAWYQRYRGRPSELMRAID